MRYAKRFFKRLDIFRNYSRVLLILCLLGLFMSKMLSVAFFLCVGLGIVFAVGASLKIPKESDIAEFVSNSHAEFEKDFRRHHSTCRESELLTVYAYSTKRVRLARSIGNRMYFPTFYTFIFYREDESMKLYMKTTYLYDASKPEIAEFCFDGQGSMVLECGDAESESEYRLVVLKNRDKVVSEFYIRNDHSWRRFVQFCGDMAELKEQKDKEKSRTCEYNKKRRW